MEIGDYFELELRKGNEYIQLKVIVYETINFRPPFLFLLLLFRDLKTYPCTFFLFDFVLFDFLKNI